MTLFEALTGGAFALLNWQHSGEFDQNFSKTSNAPGFAWGGGGMGGFGIDRYVILAPLSLLRTGLFESSIFALRWLTTVLMEYKSTTFNSFEKGFKLFFSSLLTVCLRLLPFYVKFEQLNVNK